MRTPHVTVNGRSFPSSSFGAMLGYPMLGRSFSRSFSSRTFLPRRAAGASSLTILLIACGQGAAPPVAPEPARAEIVSGADGAPRAEQPTSDQERSSDRPENSDSAPRSPGTPTSEENSFRLELPRDLAFLERALPAAFPERYRTFVERKQISVGHGYLYGTELLADGTSLLVASGEERSVRIYERSSGLLRTKIPIAGSEDYQASALGWPELASNGAPLVVTASGSGLRLTSAKDGSELVLLSPDPVDSIVFSPDQRVLGAISSKIPEQVSTLSFFVRDGLELRPFGKFSFSERVDDAAFSRDNRLLAVSHYPADELRVIDLIAGADVLRVPAPRYAGSVDFSPDGRYVAIGGEGLLVVDLVNPSRRAYFDHIYNNISTVRFSPSGDAIAISAYDGRLRVLELVSREGDQERLELRLSKELRHAGTANVYGFSFDPDGDGLVSASGDRTVRWFRGQGKHPQGASSETRFKTLAEWKALAPHAATPVSPPSVSRTMDGMLIVPALSLPPRPTRLAPGAYDCKITKIYRMRDCTIERLPSGHTWLRFEPGNLFSLAGVIYDDGDVVRFEGSLEERSEVLDCRDCEKQPIHGVLRGSARRLEGVLVFKTYYDPMNPPEPPAKDVRFEEANGRFPIELSLRKKPD